MAQFCSDKLLQHRDMAELSYQILNFTVNERSYREGYQMATVVLGLKQVQHLEAERD